MSNGAADTDSDISLDTPAHTQAAPETHIHVRMPEELSQTMEAMLMILRDMRNRQIVSGMSYPLLCAFSW